MQLKKYDCIITTIVEQINRRYHLEMTRTTYDAADDLCFVKFGGHAVDIEDEFELGLIDKYLKVSIII